MSGPGRGLFFISVGLLVIALALQDVWIAALAWVVLWAGAVAQDRFNRRYP